MILDLDDQRSKLPGLKAVSFDLFDTLITRSVANPEGIFLKLGKELSEKGLIDCSPNAFAHARYVCEKRARINSSREEVTFREIYEEIAFGSPLQSSIDAMMELELEIEKKSLYPITPMVEQVAKAREAYGSAIFISDMYLPTHFLREILEELGIYKEGDSLYVSNDHFAQKGSGRLFEIVLEENKLKPNELLHVGNSLDYDIDPARALGIHTFNFDAGNQGRSEEILATHGDDTDGFADHLAGAIRLTRLNCPPDLDERDQTLWQSAATVTGPFLYLYAYWVLQRAQHLGVKKLVFLARDAFFMKTVFDDIVERENCEGLETIYLFGSRQTYKYLGIEKLDTSAWDTIFGSDATTWPSLEALAREVHSPATELSGKLSEHGIATPSDQPLAEDLFANIKEAILTPGDLNEWILRNIEAGIERQADYLRQQKVLGSEKMAIVDAGWTTRSHAPFFNYLVANGSEDLRLFYTALIVEKDKLKIDSENIDSFMFDWANKRGKVQFRRDIYYPRALETLLISRHGRTIGFENREGIIEPVLASQSNQDLSDQSIDLYERSINQFAKFAAAHGNQPSPVFDARLLAQEILKHFWLNPDKREARLWSSLSWEWDASGTIQYPLARSYQLSDIWNAFSSNGLPRCYPQFWIGGAKQLTPNSTLVLLKVVIRIRGVYSRMLQAIPKGPQKLIRRFANHFKDPKHKLRY